MLLSMWQVGGFLLAAILIILSPGPDNLMVLSLGIARGRKSGIAFGLGCALGCLSHTALAALGISALIAASPKAFMALKLCGGGYLLWLGIQAARSSGRMALAAEGVQGADSRLLPLFLKGLLANAINPKVILFFLAFLPQFVDASRGASGWQMAQLGLLFTALSVIMFSAFGYFAGSLGRLIRRVPRVGAWLDRAAAGVFILLGLRLIAAP